MTKKTPVCETTPQHLEVDKTNKTIQKLLKDCNFTACLGLHLYNNFTSIDKLMAEANDTGNIVIYQGYLKVLNTKISAKLHNVEYSQIQIDSDLRTYELIFHTSEKLFRDFTVEEIAEIIGPEATVELKNMYFEAKEHLPLEVSRVRSIELEREDWQREHGLY